MMTAWSYRGHRMERALDITTGRWIDLWRVDGKCPPRAWNEALELIDSWEEGDPPLRFKCGECGNWEFPKNWSSGPMLQRKGLCFDCAFWSEFAQQVQLRPDLNFVIWGNGYSRVLDESDPPAMRAHGGREFKVRWPSGKVATTKNLWLRGEIPPRWRERLPDTAEWAEEGEER